MGTNLFDKNRWQSSCQQLMHHSFTQAFTPMHRLFLFSQSVDDALGNILHQHRAEAIAIARGFGYESWQERSQYADCFAPSAEMPLGAS